MQYQPVDVGLGAPECVAGRKEVRQLRARPLAQSDEVDGLAPRCPLLSTASCRHLANHARQHIGRTFPADDVQALESLVDEIERVPAIGIGAVGPGGKEEIRESRRRVFIFGVFSGHAIYFPELFPTQIRSTGVAFCNGAARVITSFGPLIAGLLAVALGGFSVAAAIMVCFALLSVVAMLMGRETKGSELPH